MWNNSRAILILLLLLPPRAPVRFQALWRLLPCQLEAGARPLAVNPLRVVHTRRRYAGRLLLARAGWKERGRRLLLVVLLPLLLL